MLAKSPRNTANEAWHATLDDILNNGEAVAPQKSTGSGDRVSFEVLSHQLAFDMRYPIVTIKPNTSWLYMAAEPMWVINGSNKLNWAPEIERIQAPYSDDQETLSGAYGPPFKQQLEYVVRTLNNDLNSRQVVMTIWKRHPFPSKDIACTVALQFIIRKGHIHCVVTMRSSDVGMGLPYDMLTFTCMAAEVASMLEEPVELGSCYITAGSRHIYQDQFDKLNYIFNNADTATYYNPWAMWAWPAIKLKLMDIAQSYADTSEDRVILQANCKQEILGLMT